MSVRLRRCWGGHSLGLCLFYLLPVVLMHFFQLASLFEEAGFKTDINSSKYYLVACLLY